MRRSTLTLVVFVTLAAAAAHGQAPGRPGARAQQPPPPPRPLTAPPAQLPDKGKLEGSVYTNDFFRVSVRVPQDWFVNRTELPEEAKEMLEGTARNRRQQEQINASVARSTILLNLTKLPPGPAEQFNAAFVVVAERIPSAVVRSGEDVLRLMEKSFENTAVKIEWLDPVHTERVGGVDFGVAGAKVTFPVGSVVQKYYVIVRNGYALQLIFSYMDEADLATLRGIVKSIKFN
ncbi:MAG TPA: hypothetical protein VEY09_12055 [Pyrinomonadaceae bacterium]|nr:hypothetical protein [Pyrinomonadaceae bacterium]